MDFEKFHLGCQTFRDWRKRIIVFLSKCLIEMGKSCYCFKGPYLILDGRKSIVRTVIFLMLFSAIDLRNVDRLTLLYVTQRICFSNLQKFVCTHCMIFFVLNVSSVFAENVIPYFSAHPTLQSHSTQATCDLQS